MAVLLTYNLQEQPYTPSFPVQPSDTDVYKYQDWPMVCNNCYKYGNTKKRDADEKQLAEMAEKITTQVTKKINAQMKLIVQTVEKNTWQEVITVNFEIQELSKSRWDKMSPKFQEMVEV